MIFLDMDGPFADFHAGYRAISGGEDPPPYFGRSKAEEDKMWRKIHATPDFFANLPLVEGALDFYHWLRLEIVTDADHAFLTACPPSKYHNVAEQKKRWVRNTLAPHSPLVIPTWGSKAKSAHIQQPGDILIDDHEANCEDWESVGGIALRFDVSAPNWEDIKDYIYAKYL